MIAQERPAIRPQINDWQHATNSIPTRGERERAIASRVLNKKDGSALTNFRREIGRHHESGVADESEREIDPCVQIDGDVAGKISETDKGSGRPDIRCVQYFACRPCGELHNRRNRRRVYVTVERGSLGR